MAQRPCFYCLGNSMNVEVCLDCRSKHERAKKDLEWFKNQADRERANFFRLSKENLKLRQEIAELRRKPRAKR